MSATSVVIFAFLALMLIGMPLFGAVGLTTALALWLIDIPVSLMGQTAFTSLQPFPLLTIPLFVLAGKLMETGGMAQHMIKIAQTLVGSYRGSMAMVTICACGLFAALSGSGPGNHGGHRQRDHPRDEAARVSSPFRCRRGRIGRGAWQHDPPVEPDDHLLPGGRGIDPAHLPGRHPSGPWGSRAAAAYGRGDFGLAWLRRGGSEIHDQAAAARAVGRQVVRLRANPDPGRYLWWRVHPDGSGLDRRVLFALRRPRHLSRPDVEGRGRCASVHRAHGGHPHHHCPILRLRPGPGVLRPARYR